ncbi:UNVERIFIED_CONTAM: hypothetical protein GTU68_056277 [Idotea baltica]|nr:hypothetical protein [Idotea baltica]
MMPFFKDKFGNPHSVEHSFGWEADAAVTVARKQIANLFNADEHEIIFTSGATESNNLALKGVAFADYPNKNHIITVKSEHECVLACARALEKMNFDVTYLDVDEDGLIDLVQLSTAINEKTALVSVMAVNNEIGVIQDIFAIGEICKKAGVIFHTDAAQAVGKIPLNVTELNVDVMSISGHKIYGPKGIGAIYVKKGTSIVPLLDGGGQENSDLLVAELRDIAISTGSACSSAKNQPSYVLEALGLSKTEIDASVRIGIGRMTTIEEVDFVANYIIGKVQDLT